MSGPTPSDSGRRGLRARELALLSMLGAVMFAAKMALAWLPNIEPVSLLVMVYAVVLGRRALYPIYVYVALECCVWGIHLWSVCYLYVWLVLYLAARRLRAMDGALGWAVLSGAFGLCFGLLCAPVYLLSGGWAFALGWWLSGIPWDALHCAGNFALALALFPALRRLLKRYMYNVGDGGGKN